MQYNILIKLYYFKYCVILLTTTKNKAGWAGRDWKEGGAVSDTIIRIRESSVDSSHFLSHLNEVRGEQKGKKSREVVINILDNGIQLRKANKDNFGIQERDQRDGGCQNLKLPSPSDKEHSEPYGIFGRLTSSSTSNALAQT